MKNRNSEEIGGYLSEFPTGGTKGRATIDNTIIFSEIVRKNRKLARYVAEHFVMGDIF